MHREAALQDLMAENGWVLAVSAAPPGCHRLRDTPDRRETDLPPHRHRRRPWDATQLSAGALAGGKSHTVPTVGHFLSRLAHSYGLVTRATLTSSRVVTDYSRALIHAVSKRLLKTSTRNYLETCWQAVTISNDQAETIIGLCGAHLHIPQLFPLTEEE